jgi:M6 family metalloprotease-like protein
MPGKLKTLVMICAIWAVLGCLSGAYLRFQPVSCNQPDGSKLELFATGDEFYNWLHDKDGYTVKQNDAGWYVYLDKKNKDELAFTTYVVGRDNPEAKGLKPWVNISPERMGEIRKQAVTQMGLSNSGRAPSTGTLNNIAIFIRFSDQTEYTQNISTYNAMFNGTTGNTMQSYFWEVSYNTLNIPTSYYPTPSTTVVSWQDSHPRGYYSPYSSSNTIGYSGDTERTDREFTLLVNAVNGVSSQIPTSLNLDGDNDGMVDNVCFIIKGGTDGWAELLWPHRWAIYDRYVYINSKRVYDFNFQLSDYLSTSGVGVLCHEMFHSLGAPDLYHYSYDGLVPVGPWDVMENDGNPPQHMSAYMKYKYGHWISTIPVLSTDGTYTLNPLTSATNNCYKIPSPNSSSEYFVVEYRRKTGTFENSLPGSGLLVYRVNPAYEGNADGPPDELYLYRPGGTTTVNGTVNSANYSSETGRTAINSTTNPTPFLTNGSAGGLNINTIGSAAGATISFVLGNPTPGMPSCQITAPTEGSGINLNSTVTVNVTATDTDGTISNVKFYIDDVLQYTDSASPYTWNWNTTGFSAGSHIIKAVATDNSSNTATSTVGVTLLAPADEGFETGNFSAFAWNNSSTIPWTVQTATKLSGTYAAQSGDISDNGTTTLSLPMVITSSGNISFYYKVSSESNYDFLKFYIDGVQQGQWSGTEGWALATYPVSSGTRTFSWTYSKDGSVSTDSDCAWLDHIIFPPYGTYFAPPQNLSAGAGNSVVNLSWQAPSGGTPSSYKIFRNGTLLSTVSGTTYTDNAVVNGTPYTYYVTAVYTSPAGESDPSNTVIATPGTVIVNDYIIGSGTSATGTSIASPINVYYESLHGQSVYTAAQLAAAGVVGPCDITRIGFNVTGLPTLAMPNFIIRMAHTTSTNVSTWISTGLTTVWTTASYQPTSTGWNMLQLPTPFAWNGTDNILVDTAFGDIGAWTSSGTVQYTNETNGYRYARNDDADQTDVFTGGSTSVYKPNIKITTSYIPPAPAIVVSPLSLAYGTVRINTTSTNTFQISNTGTATLSGNITTPTGYSVTLGRAENSAETGLALASETKESTRNTLAYSISAGSSSTFTVTFSPTAIQAYNGYITITHNADGASKAVALTGQGGKPTIGLSATSFSADLALGASVNQTLSVSNSGNMALNYSLTENGSVSWLTLNGGSSVSNTITVGGVAQSVTIGFNSTGLAVGTYNATINGTSNDPNYATFNIPITMNLYDPNTAPVIDLPAEIQVSKNNTLDVDFSTYVSDADGDMLWLTYIGSAHVTVSLNGLTVTFTPEADWTGTEELSFIVHDGSAEATDVVSVVVSNTVPVLDLPESFSFDRNGSLSVDLGPYISDGNGDTLSLMFTGNTGVNISVDGSVVTFTNDPAFAGSEDITFTVSDGTDSADDVVTVIVVNHQPVLDLPASVSLNENGSFTLDCSAYISDPDLDVLVLAYSGNSNVNVTIDGFSVTFTPALDWYGTEDISFSLSDGYLEAYDMVQVIVNQVISALDTPVISLNLNAGATRLQWDAIANATEYWIFRADDPYGSYYQIGTTASLEFTDNTILPKAFYQVKAVYTPIAK